MPIALPLLLLGGAAIVMGGKKRRPRSKSPDNSGGVGEGAPTPWFLEEYYKRKGEAEWRAKRCANGDDFLGAALPALKGRLDEYRNAAMAEGNVGFGEGEPGGIAFKADLQAIVENLFTTHCE
jgi:hypothetical protein